MAPRRIELSRAYELPVSRVFQALADHENFSNLFGIPVHRVRDGEGDVNGVGSVRRLGVGPIAMEETVLAIEPQRSIDYAITKNGGPIKAHHGHVEFEETDGGSRVRWTITFDAPPVIGPVLERVLATAIGRGLRRIR